MTRVHPAARRRVRTLLRSLGGALIALLCLSSLARAAIFELNPVGDVDGRTNPNGTSFIPSGLNNSDEVVGMAFTAGGHPYGAAWSLQNQTLSELPTIAAPPADHADPATQPLAVNDHGQIDGLACEAWREDQTYGAGSSCATGYGVAAYYPAEWDNAGAAPAPFSSRAAVADTGPANINGAGDYLASVYGQPGYTTTVLIRPSGTQVTLPHSFSGGQFAINGADQVVASGGMPANECSDFGPAGALQNCFWAGPTTEPVGLDFVPRRILDDGSIVGVNSSGPATSIVVRDRNGNETVTPSGLAGISDVNRNGVAAGYVLNAQGQTDAAVSVNGKAIDLNTLVPANSGWTLDGAALINDDGDVAGHGSVNGIGHSYLLQRGTLDVALAAFDEQGNALTGSISRTQDVDVVEAITNNTGSDLHGLSFDRGQVLGTEQGSGGIAITAGPVPVIAPGSVLPKGKTLVVYSVVSATKLGRSAVDTKVSAVDASGSSFTGQGSLRFDIGDGQKLNQAVAKFLQIQALDAFMRKAYTSWRNLLGNRARQVHDLLARTMSRAQRIRWFGSATRLVPTLLDNAYALLRGSSPDLVAAQTPRVANGSLSAAELQRAYNQAFAQKVGDGVSEYVSGWNHLGDAARRTLASSWREAALSFNYYWGSATPEERSQFEAQAMHLVEGAQTTGRSVITQLANESHHLVDDGVYLVDAYANFLRDVSGDAPDLKAAVRQEKLREENWIRNAPNDPLQFERDMAGRDAEIFNAGLAAIADQVVGGAATRVGGRLIRGAGGALIRTGEASGVLDSAGRVIRGPSIPTPDLSVPGGVPAVDAAALGTEGQFLAETERATVVKSADTGGEAYKVANVGGVPETVIDAKADVLKQLEKEYKAATGEDVKLAEVLKPGTPLEKPGGVAKLELTEQKTLKPAALAAGLPSDALGEAGVWRSTKPPSELPGWSALSEPEQQAAQSTWENANEAWDDFEKPPAGSKTARLKQCIGRRCTVPLDLKPNAAGQQRFVTAEYEIKTLTQGDAEAKLIRVKYYRVEVLDNGKLVNSKVVVNSKVALPQTPDADAVALGKVAGNGEIRPLSRAEREFIYQRYIDKNVKLRLSGEVPALAEHGATLVFDDGSSTLAGKLLPRYGVIFLPQDIGLAYLKRISPFVIPLDPVTHLPLYTDAQMFQQMVDVVRSEGGFGQRAIVVTADTRYFGEVPFSKW